MPLDRKGLPNTSESRQGSEIASDPAAETEPASRYRIPLTEFVRSQARPVEKFGHQPRLYALTRQVGRGYTYDDDVVFAAAWLHDLGVFEGHRPANPAELATWDNTAYAMRQAPEALRKVAFPAEKIAAVVEAIRTHQPDRDPQTLEGTVLRDADILEQLGSIGVLRVAAKVGRDTRYSVFGDVVLTLRKSLLDLPGKLRLETAKLLAEPRVASLRAFLEELERETEGGLF